MFRVETVEQISETSRGTYKVFTCGGNELLTLKDGYSVAIIMKYFMMMNQDPRRADDFMAGVIDGMIHKDMVARENASLV